MTINSAWTSITGLYLYRLVIGAHRAGVTPVPIPNTEVKPSIGEDTALRESSTVPNYPGTTRKGGFWFMWAKRVQIEVYPWCVNLR